MSFAQKFKEVFKATTEQRLAYCSWAQHRARLWGLQVTPARHTELTGAGTSTAGEIESPNTTMM